MPIIRKIPRRGNAISPFNDVSFAEGRPHINAVALLLLLYVLDWARLYKVCAPVPHNAPASFFIDPFLLVDLLSYVYRCVARSNRPVVPLTRIFFFARACSSFLS